MLSRRQLRIKAIKALYAHLQTESDSMIQTERAMFASIDKAYDLYIQMLALPAAIVAYAQSRIDFARQKRLPTYEDLNPNTRFVDNAVVRVLSTTDAINDRLAARKIGWADAPEAVRALYNTLIATESYKNYMAAPETSFLADREVIERFFVDELQDNEVLDGALEAMSIEWTDDLPFALMMALRTLSNLRRSHTEVKILPEFKSDDDRDFVKTLFERTLMGYRDLSRMVDRYSSNWDIERLVFMDNLIIVTALTEMIECPSIPVKVTLDEYIEIAKYYSTPASANYINGVLDRISKQLVEEGTINKTGRGLI